MRSFQRFAPRLIQTCRAAASISVGGTSYGIPHESMKLLQVLRHHSFPMEFDCLQGSCKKCMVEVRLAGEQANVLACQEEALDGMQVLLDVAPDANLSRLRELGARERAQKQMLSRRTVKTTVRTKGKSEGDNALTFDYRERLEEVIAMRALMDSDLKPPEKLAQIQGLLESFDGKKFTNVNEFFKLDSWMKKQSWGRDKQRATRLRTYISNRILSEQEAIPEVETMAC